VDLYILNAKLLCTSEKALSRIVLPIDKKFQMGFTNMETDQQITRQFPAK
jgi:hypothetical protein